MLGACLFPSVTLHTTEHKRFVGWRLSPDLCNLKSLIFYLHRVRNRGASQVVRTMQRCQVSSRCNCCNTYGPLTQLQCSRSGIFPDTFINEKLLPGALDRPGYQKEQCSLFLTFALMFNKDALLDPHLNWIRQWDILVKTVELMPSSVTTYSRTQWACLGNACVLLSPLGNRMMISIVMQVE